MNNKKALNFKEKFVLFLGLKLNIKLKDFKKVIGLKSKLNKLESAGFIISKAGKGKIKAINNKSGQKVFLRKYSSDIEVFKQVFLDKSYEKLIQTVQKYSPAEKDTLKVIDAGANIGLFSIYLQQFYSNLKVIAIEPDKGNAETAILNFNANNIGGYNILNGALWFEKTRVGLSNTFRDGKEWSFSIDPTKKDKYIKTHTLHDIIPEYFKHNNIDILKIDIEGSEKYLFQNDYANYFLSKTKYIAIEIHDEFKCRDLIYKQMEANGFDFFNDGELTIGRNISLTQ